MFIKLARKFKNVPNSENYQLLLITTNYASTSSTYVTHKQSIFFATIFVQFIGYLNFKVNASRNG
jgi:hypothetical protein